MPSNELFREELALAWGEEYSSLPAPAQAILLEDFKYKWENEGGYNAYGSVQQCAEDYRDSIYVGNLASHVQACARHYA